MAHSVPSDQYVWAQMSWDDFSAWERASEVSGPRKTRKLSGCRVFSQFVDVSGRAPAVFISNLTRRKYCVETRVVCFGWKTVQQLAEMHPAVEASLAGDKQSDGKTVEDVMKDSHKARNSHPGETVKTCGCDWRDATVIIWRASHRASHPISRETERAHPHLHLHTRSQPHTLMCFPPSYLWHISWRLHFFPFRQHRKDPTGVCETPNEQLRILKSDCSV